MTTNYFWTILAMDSALSEDGLTDVVKLVFWLRCCKVVDGDKEYYADTNGVLHCEPPSPAAFTPYADLTFDQVCGWLDSSYDVAALDKSLDISIANQMNPPVVQLPLPWAPQSEA